MEAGATQQREDWIRSNERALHYYGGGVQVIIPDNLQRGQSLRPLRTGHQPPVRGVDLRWAGPPTSFAIGSRLALSTDAATYWRAIRVGSGYVPSDSPRVHLVNGIVGESARRSGTYPARSCC